MRVASYGLWVAGYGLRVAGYGLRVLEDRGRRWVRIEVEKLRRLEDRRSEVRSQRSEGRRQRSEGRRQRSAIADKIG